MLQHLYCFDFLCTMSNSGTGDKGRVQECFLKLTYLKLPKLTASAALYCMFDLLSQCKLT